MTEGKKAHRKQPAGVDTFPYEFLNFGRTEDMLWLKNSAIDTSITGMIFADLKGRIFYANDAAVRLWRCSDPADYINQFAGKFSRSKSRSIEILNTVQSKGVWIGEFAGIRKDGTFNHVYLQMNLVRNRSGKPICLMYSFMDITEKKELQEQMRIKDIAIEKSITGILLMDLNGVITFVNDATAMIWEYEKSEILGQYASRFARSRDDILHVFRIVQKEGYWKGEIDGIRKDKTVIWTHMSASLIRDISDEPVCVMCSFVDVTEQKRLQEQLKKSYDQLEIRVTERTKELQILNSENLKEIEERKHAEKLLLQKEKDLIEKSRELEEMNAALKVLLKQREKDKEHLEIDVFSNIEKNILPYIKKALNSKKIGNKEKEYLLTIESNIQNIVSPFLRKLQTTYQKLTPTEIQVANLIRDDKSTKEIATLLDTSIRAIEFHRKNIRTKLNLTNKKLNLKSHLISLV